MNDDSNLKALGYLALIILCVIGFILMRSCDRQDATAILEREGYTQITLQDFSLYTCGVAKLNQSGTPISEIAQAFKAISPDGKPVEGVVCMRGFSGYVKIGRFNP